MTARTASISHFAPAAFSGSAATRRGFAARTGSAFDGFAAGLVPARRTGFTLMEILAVLVIIGILATSAALTLRRTAPRETADQFEARLADWSEHARWQAENERRPFALELHPGAKAWSSHPDGRAEPARECPLPRGWALIGLRGETVPWTGSPLLLPLDIHGQGASIALELRDPQGEYRFLVMTGLTGQTLWFDQKDAADACFAQKAMEGKRVDGSRQAAEGGRP